MHQRAKDRSVPVTVQADEGALSRSAVLNDKGRTIKLHYTDTGPALNRAPVIALLHGSGPGSTGWSNFAANRPALVDAGFRLICIDLPGWGRSDALVCTEDRSALNARALLAILNAAQADAPVHLIGASMGAHSAVAFALQWPERTAKLVLVSGGTGGGAAASIPPGPRACVQCWTFIRHLPRGICGGSWSLYRLTSAISPTKWCKRGWRRHNRSQSTWKTSA